MSITHRSAALAAIVALTLTHIGIAQQGTPAQQQGAPASAQPRPADEQQAGDQPTQPTFRTGINFVRVDVIVTDRKGQPVIDLKPTDFEIVEDGTPQKIEQFRLISFDEASQLDGTPPRQIRSRFDEESEAARDDARIFVIFFDDYHTRVGSALGVKKPLINFVQKHLQPSDLLAVMYPLTPLDALTLTRNQDSVVSAIERFEGRKYRYDPKNEFEERYANYPTEVVEQIRNQVVMTALRGLATRLGSLREGRKAIIFVSEGLTTILPPQMRNPIATLPGFGNPDARDPLAGENSQIEDRAAFFAGADLQSQMRDVYDAANRNNAAIYALDPRGLAGFEYGVEEGVGLQQDLKHLQTSQDTLRVLADETDGRAIVNRNDLERGLSQVVRDSSAYYLIGYNSSEAPNDGKFHEIKVRVKRPGIEVRARKGYWAPTAEDTARAIAGPRPEPPKAVQQALASIVAPRGNAARYVQTWIGTSRGENGKTRVTFVWEPAPAPPGVRREEAGRVSLLAAASDGGLVFRGRVPDAAVASTDARQAAVAAVRSAPASGGPQRVVFDAPPGKMELRVSVEAAGGGGVLDTEVREVDVPDLTTPDTRLSTARVFRARNAREFQALAGDRDAVPVAGREFRRTERLLIRFDAYVPGGAPTAALLNRNGQKMADVPVSPASTGGTHQIDLGLGSIAPGEYLVEITMKNDGGDAKELVAVRVVS